MSEGIIVFSDEIITFSNIAFKNIVKNIKSYDDKEVDIFDHKLFSIYKSGDSVDLPQKKKNRKKKSK